MIGGQTTEWVFEPKYAVITYIEHECTQGVGGLSNTYDEANVLTNKIFDALWELLQRRSTEFWGEIHTASRSAPVSKAPKRHLCPNCECDWNETVCENCGYND